MLAGGVCIAQRSTRRTAGLHTSQLAVTPQYQLTYAGALPTPQTLLPVHSMSTHTVCCPVNCQCSKLAAALISATDWVMPLLPSGIAYQSPGDLSGLTLRNQWQTAFAIKPQWVFITGWNEHIAQVLCCAQRRDVHRCPATSCLHQHHRVLNARQSS